MPVEIKVQIVLHFKALRSRVWSHFTLCQSRSKLEHLLHTMGFIVREVIGTLHTLHYKIGAVGTFN